MFAIVAAALLAAIESLADAGHWKRARAKAEEARLAESNDARALWLASRVKLAFSELDEAAKLAERAAALDPKNAGYQLQIAEVWGTVAHRAPVWRQLGPGRRCKKAMDAAFALDPRHVENLFILMQYYQRAPGFMGGDKKRAAEIPARIREVDAARGWMAEAKLAEIRKDAAGQESALRRAVEANVRHYGARIELAAHLLRRGDAKSAAEQARTAAGIHPDRVEAYQILARALDPGPALEAVLAEAAVRVPDDLSPFYEAARRVSARRQAWIERYLSQPPEPTAPSHGDARKLLKHAGS